MKLIKSSYSIIKNPPVYSTGGDKECREALLQQIYKDIERAGRVCYKSENKTTDDSAEKFVKMLISNGHHSCLEHGTVYLTFSNEEYLRVSEYVKNKYSEVVFDEDSSNYLVTTNYREIVKNDLYTDLDYLCVPTPLHEKRISVHITCDRGVMAELTRERVFSFAVESTRFCNYTKDKFGNQLQITQPLSIEDEDVERCVFYTVRKIIGSSFTDEDILYEREVKEWNAVDWWFWANSCAELAYKKLIGFGWKPQEARRVLPLDTKTEVYMTGFINDWKIMLEKRTFPDCHPDMLTLTIPLRTEFIETILNK